MQASTDRSFPALSSIPGRLAWLLIGVAHAPALASSWRNLLAGHSGFGGFSASGLLGFFSLLAAVLFFALKAFDAPFLRLRLTNRAWVALIMAAALIHVDALGPEIDGSLVPHVAKIVAASFLVGGLASNRKRLPGTTAYVGKRRQAHRPRIVFWNSTTVETYSRPGWLLASRLHALRGPPA